MIKSIPAVLLAIALPLPLAAQGIRSEEQSARAAGVAGAFVAQVDDPSAILYNPGALGLLKKKKGAAVGTSEARAGQVLFQGTAPGIAAGTTGEQKTPLMTLPYAFLTAPLGKRLVSGVGIYSPYREQSEWATPSSYAGRFLATRSRIEPTDVTTAFGLRVSSFLGVGGGLIVRSSKLAAARRLFDAPPDVATLEMTTNPARARGWNAHAPPVWATLEMTPDTVRARGWNAGVLLRPGPRLSVGATYRSRIRASYQGSGKLTQIATGDAQLDQLIAASYPFGQELGLVSQLEFPAQKIAGIAFGPSPSLLFEVDAARSEWHGVPGIAFSFPDKPFLNTVYPLALDKSTALRGGVRYQFPTGPQLRFGYAAVRTPQPDQTVGAFLADANRNTITAGFGLDWLDLAVGWSSYAKRSIVTNVDALNGEYRANGWTLTLSVTKQRYGITTVACVVLLPEMF